MGEIWVFCSLLCQAVYLISSTLKESGGMWCFWKVWNFTTLTCTSWSQGKNPHDAFPPSSVRATRAETHTLYMYIYVVCMRVCMCIIIELKQPLHSSLSLCWPTYKQHNDKKKQIMNNDYIFEKLWLWIHLISGFYLSTGKYCKKTLNFLKVYSNVPQLSGSDGSVRLS